MYEKMRSGSLFRGSVISRMVAFSMDLLATQLYQARGVVSGLINKVVNRKRSKGLRCYLRLES